jgi:LPXTG-motif cell wall-anchored protein
VRQLTQEMVMFKKIFTTGCAVATLVLGGVTAAEAQSPRDKPIYFTFSEPVTLPQMTLPAGKYLFRLADSLVNRTIVQIYNEDGTKLHGMLMTIPALRNDPPNDPEVRFLETAANVPPAIGSYWYPGERGGWEFIYPREQAAKIASGAKQSVLTTAQNASGDEMRTADLVRVSPTGQQTAVTADAAPMTVAGQAQRGEVATNPPAVAGATSAQTGTPASTAATARSSASTRTPSDAPAMQADASTQTRRSLPATASSTPALALAGVASLLAAFGIGLVRRRVI